MKVDCVKKWKKKEADIRWAKQIQDKFQISPLLATILSTRPLKNFEDIKKFMQPKMADLHDPFLFGDMQKAKERVLQAISDREKIVIYGDYDADGITSTAILMRALCALQADVTYYIPNRFTEGYGPNEKAFKKIADAGCTLLITVDNGIAATREMQLAKNLGMDVILTDHHAYQEEIPEAYAIIHPKNSLDAYPFSELCGAGVALKLAQALHGKLQDVWLELAAIGTICDLMPLLDENRVIVKSGLQRMMMTKLPGLRMMLKARKIELHEIEVDTIGFIVGPRLNAVGRLHHAKDAVELLITDDERYALELVEKLEDYNQKRKKIVQKITKEATEQAQKQMEQGNRFILVLADETWNPGVIGIVASKIVSLFQRPTIILGKGENDCFKGSGRSIEAFHIFEALSQTSEFLLHFGGHKMAAGLELKMEQLEAFRNAIDAVAQKTLSEEDFIPQLLVDYSGTIKEFTVSTIQELDLLAPFGNENPRPLIGLEHVVLHEARAIGAGEKHLRLVVKDQNILFQCIGFQLGSYVSRLKKGMKIGVAGTLGINEWNQSVMPQLKVEDIQLEKEQRIIPLLNGYTELANLEQAVWILPTQTCKGKYHISSRHEIFYMSDPNFIQDASRLVSKHWVVGVDLTNCEGEILRCLHVAETIYILPFWQDEIYSRKIEREDFVRLYKKLREYQVITSREMLEVIGNQMDISQENINFFLKVFFELGFAIIDRDKIFMIEKPRKRELTESPTYRARIDRLRQLYAYESYTFRDWKKWLQQLGVS